MNVGINDNITALYQLQLARQNKIAANNNSCAPSVASSEKSELSKKSKIGIGICTGIGTAASLMLLAKLDRSHNYTINPLKMFKGDLRKSFMAEKQYKTKEIVTIGAGSILGGLIGGTIFGDKKDSNARVREGIVQMANITFPIAIVQALSWTGTKISEKTMPNWCITENVFKQAVTKLPPAIGAMCGLLTGMYIGNRFSNRLNEKLFNKQDNRPMKWKDFSAHVDDIGVAATFVAPNNFITKTISRLIPIALFVPGYETGTKKESVK